MADPEPRNAQADAAPPVCHHCGDEAEVQWQRHATQAEYDALADSPLRPVDGVMLVAVFACGDHELPPICESHPLPAPVRCPKCGAEPGAGCTKGNGEPRRDHTQRAAAQPGPETCRHVHRADCPGYGACQCSKDDAPPGRTPYQAPPTVSHAEQAAALQKIHEAELAWYAKLLIEAGNDAQEAARLARAAFGEFIAAPTLPESFTATPPPIRDAGPF